MPRASTTTPGSSAGNSADRPAVRLDGATGKAVTLKDIAQHVGVSATTVSAALHGTGRVSRELRHEIFEVAKAFDYRPKLAAQMLRSQETGYLGLIFCGTTPREVVDSGYLGPMLAHFVSACGEEGLNYQVEFITPLPESGQMMAPPRYMAGGLVDAAIVVGCPDPVLRQWLELKNTRPWVAVGEPARMCVLDHSELGIYRAAERLAALGHRRIAYVSGVQQFSTHAKGLKGYRRAVADFALHDDPALAHVSAINEHTDRQKNMDDCLEWTRSLLIRPNRPTAWICHSVVFARAVVVTMLEYGLRVPHDGSVIGYGSSTEAERSYPAISCIQPNFERLVRESLRMIQLRLKRDGPAQSTVHIDPDLVIRHTVAPPPTR